MSDFNNQEQRTVVVQRDCPARLVPAGTPITIKKNSFVNIKQALGGTYTITLNGNMARIDGTDADAIGMKPMELEFAEATDNKVRNSDVETALASVYDPEMPASILALGLVYEWHVDSDNMVQIQMTLTAPTCGMGPVLISDVEYRVGKVPNVAGVHVELVFDPPWSREMISEEAQFELGLFF